MSKVEFEYFLGLERRFENPPEVRLELISQAPAGKPEVKVTDIAVTTAIQCYAPGVAQMKPRTDEKARQIAESTLDAGHNTTRLHTYFTWKLNGVSRNVVHDVFHSTPFYNTEQQSQRYVEAKAGSYLVPGGLTESQRAFYLSAAEYTNKMYFEMLQALHPEVERRLREMYPKGGKIAEERLSGKAGKICQEVARYVLPIGQLTVLDYTLSELQLLRLFRASRMANFSDEARFVVAKMINEVAKVDSSIFTELRLPLDPAKEKGIKEEYIRRQKGVFDAFLAGRQSRMKALDNQARSFLVLSARNVLGISSEQISDQEVLFLMMDPRKNPFLADVYETGMFDPLTNCLRQVSLSFATKLSHTADSQRQRHRRTPGATPSIDYLYDGSVDFITPLVIRENPVLDERYSKIMADVFGNVEKCLDMGISRQDALLLLPNALTVRLVEEGDLFDWFHRFKQRLCYVAQEEIFFISVEQVKQFSGFFPEAGKMLLAPCGIRQEAGIKSRCPEGNRWCGQPVFNFKIDEYVGRRLV